MMKLISQKYQTKTSLKNFLFKRQSNRKRQTSTLLWFIPPHAYTNQGKARLKARTQNTNMVSHEDGETQLLNTSPDAFMQEVVRNRIIQIYTQARGYGT